MCVSLVLLSVPSVLTATSCPRIDGAYVEKLVLLLLGYLTISLFRPARYLEIQLSFSCPRFFLNLTIEEQIINFVCGLSSRRNTPFKSKLTCPSDGK